MREAQAPRRAGAGHRATSSARTIAREVGRRRLHPRRPGDRRGLDQGLHQPGRGAGAAHALPRAAARTCAPRRGTRDRRRRCDAIPEQMRARSWSAATRSEAIAERLRAATTTSSTSGAACNFPVALEGALKLKEISYIHAEGYPAAEMKHGPIALIDEHMPVVFLCHARQRLRQGDEQHRGGAGAQGRDHRRRDRGRHRDRAPRRPRDLRPADPVHAAARCSP